ncbi:MAG: hypothetical protein ABI743_01950 [bacterium]
MRLITLSALALLTAVLGSVGCGGGETVTSASTPAVSGQGVPAGLLAEIAAAEAAKPASTLEVIDAETGAVVLRDVIPQDADGGHDLAIRDGQTLHNDPILNRVFRSTMTLRTDGPAGTTPRGYTQSGNPLYYIGDTVYYDSALATLNPGRARYMSALGALDVEFRHTFASDDSLIPSCVAGQNPLTIQDVNYTNHTPNAGAFRFSQDGGTFTATGLQFALCNMPGMQYGTDQISTRLYWVVPGATFGLPCQSCEVRCVIFDRVVGIYDPS